jgi:4-alpha-glucanotransferase
MPSSACALAPPLTARASGILLHPTSIPTHYGIGDLGPAAKHFVDWLADAGQAYWQVLPLGPVDKSFSPYQSPSAFAGNPLLISPDRLLAQGLLTQAECDSIKSEEYRTQLRIPFAEVAARKEPLLRQAAARLLNRPGDDRLKQEYTAFCERSTWLPQFCQFMAAVEVTDNTPWPDWPTSLVASLPNAQLELIAAFQFLFFSQWQELRAYALEKGIRLIGDIPIYVAHQSAEVWGAPDLFQLDLSGRPTHVAGVPPDYFSATGQLWNNPLFDWPRHEATGFAWWISRLKQTLELVDVVRLDHFRGFEAYWSVPAGEATAINGSWQLGPGKSLFQAFALALENASPLPLIAEDLGLITKEVNALRTAIGLPGMKVLQFMLPSEDPFEPLTWEENSIVYSGTHDNDTSRSWYEEAVKANPWWLERLTPFSNRQLNSIAWDLTALAWASQSRLAIAPLQDVLGLGGEARMNTPGTFGPAATNWQWQYPSEALTAHLANRLKEMTLLHHRASAAV